MDSSYSKAIAFVLKQEGGYSNHPKDPGGPTNYGITIHDARKYWKSDAQAADVKAMPLSVAKNIYYSKYWLAVQGPAIAAGLDLCTFDSAVNSGVGRADDWLAHSLPATNKGYKELARLSHQVQDLPKAIDRFCDKRLSFLHGLRTWSTFGKGWGRRVSELRALAKVLALQASGKPAGEIKGFLATEVAATKAKQAKDAPTAATAGAGAAGGTWSFWEWDFTHVAIAAVAVVVVLYFVRKVILNNQQVKAYNDQIEALSAVIPDAHV